MSVQPAVEPQTAVETVAVPWARAREICYRTGQNAARPPVATRLAACDGATLAADLSPLTDLPAFFGSADGSDLGERIRIMLDSTKLLFDPATMRTYTLSEYIVKS